MQRAYAIVGTGGRAAMFIEALAGEYAQWGRLVGFCDLSTQRMAYYNKRINDLSGLDPVPTYTADHFDTMLHEQRPDVVIVCTIDALHHEYAVRAMKAGCDVICEKPMAVNAEQARAMIETSEQTGRSLRVTFNLRYVPYAVKVRELIRDGIIGRPTLVDLQWMLDTSHGADYFRRWHREKANSGGLLVHKSTHHFDLVNWWLNSSPKMVQAQGELAFYGEEAAAERGESYSYDRYTGHEEAANDPFALMLDKSEDSDKLRALYFNAENESGYVRDRNVFGSGIDIEDTVGIVARYRNRAILSYSLVAYSPWEGMRLSITGTRGRIELETYISNHVMSSDSGPKRNVDKRQSLRVCPMFAEPYEVTIPTVEGGHDGADTGLLRDLFDPESGPDLLNQTADHWAGAASLLVGISANESIRTGQQVHCDDLLEVPKLNAALT